MTVFFEEQRFRFRTEQNNSTFRTQSRACSFFRGSWLQSIVRVSIVTVPAPFCTSISDWTLWLHSRGRDCHTHCFRDCHTHCLRDCHTRCLRDCHTHCLRDCHTHCLRDCHIHCLWDCHIYSLFAGLPRSLFYGTATLTVCSLF